MKDLSQKGAKKGDKFDYKVGGYTGIQAVVITYLDTPNATDPTTYHIEGVNLNNDHNLLINYRGAGTFTTTSHMTITEIIP